MTTVSNKDDPLMVSLTKPIVTDTLTNTESETLGPIASETHVVVSELPIDKLTIPDSPKATKKNDEPSLDTNTGVNLFTKIKDIPVPPESDLPLDKDHH